MKFLSFIGFAVIVGGLFYLARKYLPHGSKSGSPGGGSGKNKA